MNFGKNSPNAAAAFSQNPARKTLITCPRWQDRRDKCAIMAKNSDENGKFARVGKNFDFEALKKKKILKTI